MSDAISGYLPHTAIEGQRWDTLAWLYYGDAYAYERIVAANPHIPLAATLPGGVTVYIPIIEVPATQSSSENLPPWKR